MPGYLVKHYFGYVYESVLEEVNMSVGKLSEADHPPQYRCASYNYRKHKQNKKAD